MVHFLDAGTNDQHRLFAVQVGAKTCRQWAESECEIFCCIHRFFNYPSENADEVMFLMLG